MQRAPWDFARKGLALLLVVTSLTAGMIGVGTATQGVAWGFLVAALAPIGIWAATRVTPEAGTSGYCDENL